MADQFLPQDFTLPDYDGADLQHGLQLYTAGGEGFLKIWIGGEDAGMDMGLLPHEGPGRSACQGL